MLIFWIVTNYSRLWHGRQLLDDKLACAHRFTFGVHTPSMRMRCYCARDSSAARRRKNPSGVNNGSVVLLGQGSCSPAHHFFLWWCLDAFVGPLAPGDIAARLFKLIAPFGDKAHQSVKAETLNFGFARAGKRASRGIAMRTLQIFCTVRRRAMRTGIPAGRRVATI